jgi:hypothetical protein
MHGTNSITMRVPQFVDTRGQRPITGLSSLSQVRSLTYRQPWSQRTLPCRGTLLSYFNLGDALVRAHSPAKAHRGRSEAEDSPKRDTRPTKRRGVITRRTNLFPILRRSNGKPEMRRRRRRSASADQSPYADPERLRAKPIRFAIS